MFHRGLLAEGQKNLGLLSLVAGAGVVVGLATVGQAYCVATVLNIAFRGEREFAAAMPLVVVLAATIAVRAGGAWLARWLGGRLAVAVKGDLRQRLLARLAARGPVYGGGDRTGELAGVLVEGIESLENYFAQFLPQLAVAVVVPLAVLSVVAQVDVLSALLLLVTAPLIPVMTALIGQWAGRLHKRRWAVLSRLSAHFLDVLQGLVTLKLFGRSREQERIIFSFCEQFRRTTLGVLRVAFLAALALELLSTISVALVAVTVGFKLLYGGIDYRAAMFVLLLAPEFYLPLRMVSGNFHAGAAALAAAERIYGLLEAEVPQSATGGGGPFDPLSGVTVELAGVSFQYPGQDGQALDRVCFTVGAGEKVALVGPSGAGKTTVVNLLLGFVAPSAGTIMVNGGDLAAIDRDAWLRQVAYIPQFPHMFAGTVADNIMLGTAGSREALVEAATAAEAHEFVMRLPDGYDTRVGAGGVSLSGGEAQRIAIARAHFRQAAVVVLDEPTRGLDPRTEKAVQKGLQRLLAGRTAIIVAHRITTARAADRIVVLASGRVAETGRHEELVARGGVYARMVSAYRGAS